MIGFKSRNNLFPLLLRLAKRVNRFSVMQRHVSPGFSFIEPNMAVICRIFDTSATKSFKERNHEESGLPNFTSD